MAQIFTIEIDVPDQVMNAGGIELFAKNFGWTPEQGSAEDFAKAQIKKYVADVFRRQWAAKKQAEAFAEADAMLTSEQ